MSGLRSVTAQRAGLVLAWVLAIFVLQGCGSVGPYFEHRYTDFTRIADVGLTITTTPQVGLYWNSLEFLVAGYCDIDGTFAGFGGGQLGVTRVYAHCWGLGYGEEIIGWGPLLDDPARKEEVLMKRRSGAVGMMTNALGVDITGNGYGDPPDYTPACVHFFPHIGYVGFVWNLRYTEIVDFLLGWFGLDIAGDDGYPVGKWSFPRRAESPDGDAGIRAKGPPSPDKGALKSSRVETVSPVPPPASAVETPKGHREEPARHRTVLVKAGETFYSIARREYDDGSRWKNLYEANRERLKLADPGALKAGSVVVIP